MRFISVSRALVVAISCVSMGAGCSYRGIAPPLQPVSSAAPQHRGTGGYWNENTLLEFNGPNGQNDPNAIIRDGQGNLYGTTPKGGDTSPSACNFDQTSPGCGVVFELSPQSSGWKQTLLHVFTGPPDGEAPFYAALARDTPGNLYGTTISGGFLNSSSCVIFWGKRNLGCGTVFKVNSRGKYHIVYRFKGEPDGYGPYGVVEDGHGNLYGTTEYGGTYNEGTIFEINSRGKETVLYSFQGGADGAAPITTVVRDAGGNLFGTTQAPPYTCYNYGSCGTVFKLDTNRHLTVLYTFTLTASGGGPNQVIRDPSSGTLYGTAWNGGTYYRVGSIWRLTKAGAFTELYAFTGYSDGKRPYGAVLLDRKGNLYGTASGGGAYNAGTIWKLNKRGKFSVLYAFLNGSSSLTNPNANLVLDPSGALYGPLEYGGACSSCGGIFELIPGAR
jgi:uncharacterized repeat protein (TIGR03803 family)